MQRLILTAAIVFGAFAFAPNAPTVEACPMCQVANEEGEGSAQENARPRAYMYSILFMLAMPATVFSSFSYGFYRLWKKQQLVDGGDTFDSAV